jgi:outer membrane receptor protein involved in Fe transport
VTFRHLLSFLWIFLLVSGKLIAQCDFLQTITPFSCEKITREAAINKLAKEQNFTISYPTGVFGSDLVSLDFHSKKISQLIRTLVGDNPINFQCAGENAIVFYHSDDLPFTLAGFIHDSETKMPVNGALVVYDQRWIETDADGYFVMEIFHMPAEIIVYHPGYDIYSVELQKVRKEEDLVHWALTPNSNLSAAIINVFDSILFVSKIGGVNLNMKEIEKIPSIAGSSGILNSLRFIPGLQSPLEVNGGMIVRGGGKDQNLILLDGMELYNPMHLFGLFSVFSQGSIQSIEFYKNSYPAQYGGRLSSVLDVHSKQGDYKQWNATLDFNPVLFEATINGPIKKDKTSLLISGRRSFTDFFPLFYEQIQNQNQLSRFKYFFYDITGTINHRFSDKSSLYFTNYFGGDKGYIRGKKVTEGSNPVQEINNDEFLQSNALSSLGWKMWLSNGFQIHAKVGFTEYKFNHENTYDLSISDQDQTYNRNTRLTYQSRIRDWKTGVYFKSTSNPNSLFQFGTENVWHRFSPASSGYFLQENDFIYYDTLFNQRKSEITEFRLFAQNLFTVGDFRLMTGLHFANFDNVSNYNSLQPRLNLSYNPSGSNKIEIGFAKTTQFILSVPNNLLGIPIDIWVPADSNIKPQQSWNYSAGYAHKFGKNLVFRADGYYKYFENITEFRSGVVDFVAEWDKALLIGKGRSYGAEFLLKKEKGKLNGWISYALSKTERSIPELNDGVWFPFQYDRRHDFNIVLNYQPNDKFKIGCTWTYASGHYLTTPESQFLITVEGKRYLIQQYGTKNNLKLPSYHRLDLGIHYNKEIGNARQTWSFTVYNIYNRQNVYYVNSSINNNGTVTFQPISILPILPSVNYAIRF